MGRSKRFELSLEIEGRREAGGNIIRRFQRLLKNQEALANEKAELIADIAVEELENLIKELQSGTASRGKGKLASYYNNRLDGAENRIVKKEFGRNQFLIYVETDDDAGPGYIFNLLNEGRPPRKVSLGPQSYEIAFIGDKPTINPASSQDTALDIDSSRVGEGNWVSISDGQTVAGFEPKNFFFIIKNRVKMRIEEEDLEDIVEIRSARTTGV